MTRPVKEILDRAASGHSPNREELIALLEIDHENEYQALFQTAYKVKKQNVGPVVYFRGLIEISNICQKDCLYCGIRKSNRKVPRFRLTIDEIVEAARWAHANQYGSLVLQGGEIQDDTHTQFIAEALRRQPDDEGRTDEVRLRAPLHAYLLCLRRERKRGEHQRRQPSAPHQSFSTVSLRRRRP